jgi:polyhydroxybutyrate depolymerase
VFVPSAFAGSPLPAVIDWHGLGSNGAQQAMFSDYETVAQAEGFLAVHPTGVPVTEGGPNSWQLRSGDATGAGRDDVAFAHGLIDELLEHWCADESRIYSTGMSNGGFFTARLICEMSNRIAAAVSVAGTYHPESCDPERPVPYLAYHGTADGVVPWDGSGESTLLAPDAPEEWTLFFTQVIPDEFGEFAADAGCDLDPAVAPIGDDVMRHEYAGCDDGVSMALFEVVEGGHTWPGSPMADVVRNALGHTTDAVDATRDGWAFMSQFQLPA